MKTNHWITLSIGIALILGIYAVPAITQPAQQAAQQTTPFYVAVLDVAQVIKAHPDFMQRQAGLQEAVQKAENEFKKRQEDIAEQQKRLEASNFKPGSPEYTRDLEKITNAVADFERDARNQQRRFALDNSRIMYDTYQDIKNAIDNFARANNIAQVTDYRNFQVDPADPTTVAEDMDQRLVWYNPNLNITQKVVQQIYASRGQQVPAAVMQALNNPTGNPLTGQAPAGQQAVNPGVTTMQR